MTVSAESPSSLAISGLESPSAASASTWTSRADKHALPAACVGNGHRARDRRSCGGRVRPPRRGEQEPAGSPPERAGDGRRRRVTPDDHHVIPTRRPQRRNSRRRALVGPWHPAEQHQRAGPRGGGHSEAVGGRLGTLAAALPGVPHVEPGVDQHVLQRLSALGGLEDEQRDGPGPRSEGLVGGVQARSAYAASHRRCQNDAPGSS